MKYWVTYKVEGRFETQVEADNKDEAIDKAGDKYCEADFGSLRDIIAEPIIVEDENENFIWESSD